MPEITPDNFNTEFDNCNDCILHTINTHAPIKTTRRKQKRLLMKPWITKGIFKSICQKQKLYKTFFNSGEASKIEYYKKYANKLTHLKEISKKFIFKTKSITKNTIQRSFGKL